MIVESRMITRNPPGREINRHKDAEDVNILDYLLIKLHLQRFKSRWRKSLLEYAVKDHKFTLIQVLENSSTQYIPVVEDLHT